MRLFRILKFDIAASQDSSPEKAIEMLKEAVRIYIETAKDLGVWEDVKADQAFLSTIEV